MTILFFFFFFNMLLCTLNRISLSAGRKQTPHSRGTEELRWIAFWASSSEEQLQLCLKGHMERSY